MSHTVRRLVRGMRSRDIRDGSGVELTRGADLHTMRELNRLLVLNCVREEGPVARVTIAQRTGLSRTTVSSIIDALLQEGLVREGSTQNAAPTGGRRAILVHFNADAGYILGVDVGRTHLTVLLTNLAAEVVARYSGPFDASQGPAVCLPLIVAALRAFVTEHGLAWTQIVGVGLGIPGPMDAQLRQLISPPRMPGWNGVDVQQILGRELNVPIYPDNDANMGALGESRFGAGRGISDLAYVKIGTGIGCGLVINGGIYRGSRGSAGELGHVTIIADGPLCDCGNRGCLEAVAGASAILQDVHAALGRDYQDVAEVVQAALSGDAACQTAIERAGDHIGIALAGLVNLVNPSVILIDGGVARAGELLIAPIRRAIATRSLAFATAAMQIVHGEQGDNAIALGAVATVIDAAFGAPATAAHAPNKAAFIAPTRHARVGHTRGATRASRSKRELS